MGKLSYSTVGSNKLEEAKVFYDGLLALVGMTPRYEHPSGGRFYAGNKSYFAVLGPYDKKDACIGNGTMAGFGFDTREEVDAFHARALQLGGTDEGAPGERGPGAYFAYFRDLDGNKLCGFKWG